MRVSPPLDPSADQGRTWLRDELANPRYNTRESLRDRFLRWLEEVLNVQAGTVGFAQLVSITLLVVAVIAVAVLVILSVRNAAQLDRSDSTDVFDEERLSADEHRARARAFGQRGEYAGAALEAYRAVIARSAERVIIDATPGRTARELSTELTAAFPDFSSAIASATATFVGVRYGDGTVGAADVDAILDLDDRLVAARPVQSVVVP